MNDFDPSLDEIVSAYVDGVATPDERARVESDPVLVERVATFRRLHDAIAAPPDPVDDEQRTAMIARALAETAPSATVHPFRRRSSAVGPIAAAAAIIALFFGLGTWLVASQDNTDADQTTAAAAPQRDASDSKSQPGPAATTPASLGAASPGSFNATGAAPAPQSAEAAKASIYLGGFADEAALRQALLAAGNSPPTNPSTTSATRSTSDASSCARTDPAGVTIYAAELRGRPVTVVVNGTRADAIDNVTCQDTPIDLANR